MGHPDDMAAENDRLRAELAEALARPSKLQKSMDLLTDMMASQNERLDQLVKMLRRREDQLKRSEREVRKLRRALGLDDPDPDAALPVPTPTTSDPPAAEAEDGSTLDPPSKKKRRRRSRGGRRPPPDHLPADHERHDVCACGHCGGRVFKRDVLTTSVYTVVPSYVRRRVIQRERVLCADPACNRPTTAPMPPMPCNRALYDCRFLAWLVVMKFGLLVPLDRIRTMLQTQGVDLAMGTLVHLMERAADLAGPIDGEHMKQLRAGPYLCFDGSGLKVLIEGQPKAWDGYIEVFTRDELTVCQFDLTKHADQLKGRMAGFNGIVVCDAESRNTAGTPGLTLAHCNAHAIRKLRDAERVQPALATEGTGYLQAVYDVEEQADLLRLFGSDRRAYRQRHSRPILSVFRAWLEEVRDGPLPPSDPMSKFSRYYLNHFDALTLFTEHGELPLDTNTAEREFQRHAKLRYASLFAGSPEGGHRWATLFGVVRTVQKCDVDVFGYLTWMFERRGSHRETFAISAAELTPMAYRELGCPGAVAAKTPTAESHVAA